MTSNTEERLAVIEECAKVAESHSFGLDIETWLLSTKKEMTTLTCHSVASAIRALAKATQ